MCQEQCTTSGMKAINMAQHTARVALRSILPSLSLSLLYLPASCCPEKMRSPSPFLVLFIFALISHACPTHPDNTALTKRDPAPLALDTSRAVPFPFPEIQAPILIYALSMIESIPDTVLDEGEDATREWLKNANNDGIVTRSVIEERQGWIAIAKW